jgi:AcrR family transcriptional regulator
VNRTDRPLAILRAAEKLFAQHGYDAVSLRQIAAEAGVPLALLDYHFGRKQALIDAIFDRWQGTVAERLAQLQAIDLAAPDRTRTLRAIVEAFVTPVLRLRRSPEGEFYGALVARELNRRTPAMRRIVRKHFDPMAHAFIDAMARVMPHATRAQVAWCYQFALGALIHHSIDERVERLSRRQNRRLDPAATKMLVDFIVGGIETATRAAS